MKARILKWLKSFLAKIEEESRKEECDFDEKEIDRIIETMNKL